MTKKQRVLEAALAEADTTIDLDDDEEVVVTKKKPAVA